MFMTVLKATFESVQKAEYPMFFNNGDWMHHWMTSQVHTTRAEENLLYRVIKTDAAIYLYIQSKHEFPKKNLEKAGLVFVKSFPIKASKNQMVQFDIFCSTNDQNLFLTDPEARKEWLTRKLSPFMSDLKITEDHIANASGKGNVKARGTYFKGSGVIIDPEKYESAAEKGFGKFKCYGMGLLLCRGC